MFYNKSMVSTLPKDFGELLTMAATDGLAITADWFHNYMWVPAFGAQFLDANNKVVLDTSGGVCRLTPTSSRYVNRRALPAIPTTAIWTFCSARARQHSASRGHGLREINRRPWRGQCGRDGCSVDSLPDYPHPWNQSEMIQININATTQKRLQPCVSSNI